MKIVYLVNNICQVGGIERVVCQLATYFAGQFDYDIEIHSIYSSDKQETYFPCSKSVRIVHYAEDWKTVSRFGQIRLIRKIMSEIKADILITCHAPISNAAILSKHVFRGKIIVTEHVTHEYYSPKRLWMNCFFFKFADSLVLLTKYDLDYYRARGVKRCAFIPNAVSIAVAEGSSLRQNCFVTTGRLEAVKGFDMLIAAFAQVHKQLPTWKLKILGDGSMRDYLESQIRANKLQDCVLLPGFVKDVQSELRSSSIFVMSSRSEGFSLALVEAMACGIPCISFAVPPSLEILADGAGLLVPCNDVNSLADAMVKLAESEQNRQYFAEKGKKRAGDFSLTKICDMWHELFQMICHD